MDRGARALGRVQVTGYGAKKKLPRPPALVFPPSHVHMIAPGGGFSLEWAALDR